MLVNLPEPQNVAASPAQRAPQRRTGRRAARRRRRYIAFLVLLASCAGIVCLAVAATLTWRDAGVVPQRALLAAPAARPSMGVPSSFASASALAVEDAQARRVYRHSIVPGGVHTAAEVVRAIAADPVVAAHYTGINTGRLRSERLAKPLSAHVSYRIGDQVYWTKARLTMAAGEHVLTDGNTTLRARCGNIISIVRRTPTFAGEPEAIEFDLPEDIATTPAPFVTDATPPPLRNVPPVVPLRWSVATLYSIPAPGVLPLLGLGLLAAWMASQRLRRRVTRA